jgi:uncharacterized SAM-binding protein YcdF (DUF218 family)
MGRHAAADGSPLLVILGAPVLADGSPGPALHRRLRCALALLRQDPPSAVVAVGGVPPRAASERPEAEAAAAWLRARGVAPERILTEPTSRNTWQNAARCARILERYPVDASRILLVTDPWHLPRAMLAFRAHGLRTRGAGCTVPAAERPPALARLLTHEAAGLAFYLWRWLLLALTSDGRGRSAC